MHCLISGLYIHLLQIDLWGNWEKNPYMIKRGFIISIMLGKNVNIDHVYKGIKVDINGCEMRVDLLPLELYDFEVILGIDWLGMYWAQTDYFAKTLIVQRLEGRRVVFKRERGISYQTVSSWLWPLERY